MNGTRNFLLGYGERLTEPIPRPSIIPDKAHPYTPADAIGRLAPRLEKALQTIDQLSPVSCPQNRSVLVLTLHPAYIAKSYFPSELLHEAQLRPVGSRPVHIRPAKWTRKGEPEECQSVELFVAGNRDSFHKWAKDISESHLSKRPAEELCRIEDIRCFQPGERLRGMALRTDKTPILMEIVLHSGLDDDFVLAGFESFLNMEGLTADFERRIYARGLCFLPARIPADKAGRLDKFSFLRVARPMPDLREFEPFIRSADGPTPIKVTLPDSGPVDTISRAAVFDGGLPLIHPATKWVRERKVDGGGAGIDACNKHGLAVTSAFLFGELREGMIATAPYCAVDSYQVIDSTTGHAKDLMDVLRRILDVLNENTYEFINFSIGPALPVEDDEVHAWTSVLDEYLADGKVLATVAAGNDGDKDWDSGNARVQVPADCVNALSVGACDTSKHACWRRAGYSCIGPGRSPGIVKPDLVGFGGTLAEPFFVLDSGTDCQAVPVQGTSFAAPFVLRLAAGIRAHFGPGISALALKALIINHCVQGVHLQREVGWGRPPATVEDIVICPDGTVTVLFQGSLEPGKYIRAPIPMPTDDLKGNVAITSTFCFACDTDPQDPSNYTRSGLEIVFRPHSDKRKKGDQANADRADFFCQRRLYQTEQELRHDAHKWETVLHGTQRKRAGSLKDPVFDVHYNARQQGQAFIGARKIPYALVVRINAPKTPDLYNKVVTRYRTILEVLQPTIEIPLVLGGA